MVSVPFRGFSFINAGNRAVLRGNYYVSVPFRGFSFINYERTFCLPVSVIVSVPFRGFSFINDWWNEYEDSQGDLRFRPLSGFFFYKRKVQVLSHFRERVSVPFRGFSFINT